MSQISKSLFRVEKYQLKAEQRNEKLKKKVRQANAMLIISKHTLDKLKYNLEVGMTPESDLSQLIPSSGDVSPILDTARGENSGIQNDNDDMKCGHSLYANPRSLTRKLLCISGMELQRLKLFLENIIENNNLEKHDAVVSVPAQTFNEAESLVEQTGPPMKHEMHQQLLLGVGNKELKLAVRRKKLGQQKE